MMETVRLDPFRAALLAVAVAGLLASAGLVIVLYAEPAEANFPGKPGKIAYAGNPGDIYTIKPDGGGRLNVTDNSTAERFPAYSPNGKRIAYAGYDGQDYEIYTINAGGGGKLQLTDNGTNDVDPYWGSQ